MEEAGTPEYQILKENLSKSLYWNQYAVVKTADRKLRRICVRRGMYVSFYQYYSICTQNT